MNRLTNKTWKNLQGELLRALAEMIKLTEINEQLDEKLTLDDKNIDLNEHPYEEDDK